jgi:hypothetical protein
VADELACRSPIDRFDPANIAPLDFSGNPLDGTVQKSGIPQQNLAIDIAGLS